MRRLPSSLLLLVLLYCRYHNVTTCDSDRNPIEVAGQCFRDTYRG